MRKLLIAMSILTSLFGCKNSQKETPQKNPETLTTNQKQDEHSKTPFVWEGANIYFLLTDRFNNGQPEKDINFERKDSTAVLRGFEGGDIAGITQKIEDGYFTDLGINAIWFTPVVEQIHGATDEGTGVTYGYHGYWTKDWTTIDPNFGTKKDLENLVKTAHANGIRVLLDVVLNHTGPVTAIDPVWPDEWVRTSPACAFDNYENTTACTLVRNLPDILTESDEPVELPDTLLAKWKEEGRLSQELDELNLFFERTGYPRAPRFYIIKWLTDYIHEFGVDGFRVDTVKHVNENAWAELKKEADYAFETWKKKHPNGVLDDKPFYMVGEVYNYGISGGRSFDFGDKKVDYFANGFTSLINFDLKNDANQTYEKVFKKYSYLLNTKFQGKSVLNYLTSHDDGNPYDADRSKPYRSANMLLLTPGASQVYYGDETMRPLKVVGAEGDANLRSYMNWEDLDTVPKVQKVHEHWQKLGKFRRDHPAIGAGKHKRLAKSPYVFSRTYIDGEYRDKVVVGLDLPKGKKSLRVKGFFGDGTVLYDAYSDTRVMVKNGKVVLENDYDTALLEPSE
ncbi:alpha-amylase family glycosyl hydrolase [Muricauda sp. SCSIO 64092]|uniref:alpha-amylase family glycosyl hydrolase n=1 Tax=Allomuricauda sp. SCSIO 64092 TaxID=2908842 RepID=UPI001FF1ADB1|nr:alpha-amylase family glycosyl hydrolase [Muricauda sp. SCSIO 64092]UOY06986.1 alpha-amylase family glycosyl hydrolase [Muricauda sp. SCSIO 64092]